MYLVSACVNLEWSIGISMVDDLLKIEGQERAYGSCLLILENVSAFVRKQPYGQLAMAN